MSKAFVKESDDQDDDELDSPQIAGVRNYITPAGHRRLKDELLQLLNAERRLRSPQRRMLRTTSLRRVTHGSRPS